MSGGLADIAAASAGPVCQIGHLWEGVIILVGLGIWIGAAAVYQYYKWRQEHDLGSVEYQEEDPADGV